MMANYLDQYPLLHAIKGIQMERTDRINNSSRSLISNASSTSLSDASQESNHNNNNNNKYHKYKAYNRYNTYKSHEHPTEYNEFEINPLFKISPYTTSSVVKPSLREHIFISKQCTKLLAEYIIAESWGSHDYGLLYKYLDYIFRCQLFKNQVIQIDNQYLMLHTGLQRRSDSEFLYALLIPNKKNVQQKWRVGFGAIKHSFLSKREILHKLRYLLQRKRTTNPMYEQTNNAYRLLSDILPKRTKFHLNLEEFLFDDSYQIEVNWEDRIITNKDRICKVLGVADIREKWKIRQLMHLFDRALEKTKKTLRLNPRLAVAQGFVDTKHCKYRMELLLPITIEYPKFSNMFYTFALAISKSTDQTEVYTAKSLLNVEMAYANARLVSYVDSSWLHPPINPPKNTSTGAESSAHNDYVLN